MSRCAPAFWPHPILATAGAKTGGEDPTPTPAQPACLLSWIQCPSSLPAPGGRTCPSETLGYPFPGLPHNHSPSHRAPSVSSCVAPSGEEPVTGASLPT